MDKLATKQQLKGRVRQRTMTGAFGRVTVDYVCCSCMSIVEDIKVGCIHCKRKREKGAEALQKFLASREG